MASNIPAALTAPIFTFDVQSGGNFESETREILLGYGLAAGALAEGNIALCNTREDARRLAGAGSMLESMFIATRHNAPAQEIWIGRVADTGTAEIRTITVANVPLLGGKACCRSLANHFNRYRRRRHGGAGGHLTRRGDQRLLQQT
jgi:phage tail sheath gpL-like